VDFLLHELRTQRVNLDVGADVDPAVGGLSPSLLRGDLRVSEWAAGD
jgi:hypothetical protein